MDVTDQNKIDLEAVNAIVYPDYFQPRQWDVLKLKLLGYTNQAVAQKLKLSEYAARDRWLEVGQILGISKPDNQRKLIQWAIEHGLIEIKF